MSAPLLVARRSLFARFVHPLLVVLLVVGFYDQRATSDDQRSGASNVGVLVLAHGGSGRWNRLAMNAVRDAKLPYPHKLVLGMAMHSHEVAAIQQAVDALEGQGIQRLVVVPLLICSASEVMDQYGYVLGLRQQGTWEEGIHPVQVRVPVVMTPALDDDPLIGDVLLERAQDMSHHPHQESVVLVSHGPTSEAYNVTWLQTIERVAQQVQAAGQFRAVVPVTMRDDAPNPVQEEATRQMREIVRWHSKEGRTLVIPLLLANGGIEDKIPKRLNGLKYTYRGRALLPHPHISQWITQRVEAALLDVQAAVAQDHPL